MKHRAFFDAPMGEEADLAHRLEQYAASNGFAIPRIKAETHYSDALWKALLNDLLPYLKHHQYTLTQDSAWLPSYHPGSRTRRLTFQGDGHQLLVGQADWRDSPDDFVVHLEGKQKVYLERKKRTDPEMVASLMAAVRNMIGQKA
jgi:hypothetical protein